MCWNKAQKDYETEERSPTVSKNNGRSVLSHRHSSTYNKVKVLAHLTHTHEQIHIGWATGALWVRAQRDLCPHLPGDRVRGKARCGHSAPPRTGHWPTGLIILSTVKRRVWKTYNTKPVPKANQQRWQATGRPRTPPTAAMRDQETAEPEGSRGNTTGRPQPRVSSVPQSPYCGSTRTISGSEKLPF